MTCIGPSSGMRVRHGQFPTRPQGSPASAFQGEMRSKPMSHRKNDGGGGTLQTVAHTPRPTLPPAVTPTQTDAATDSLPHTHTHTLVHTKNPVEKERSHQQTATEQVHAETFFHSGKSNSRAFESYQGRSSEVSKVCRSSRGPKRWVPLAERNTGL